MRARFFPSDASVLRLAGASGEDGQRVPVELQIGGVQAGSRGREFHRRGDIPHIAAEGSNDVTDRFVGFRVGLADGDLDILLGCRGIMRHCGGPLPGLGLRVRDGDHFCFVNAAAYSRQTMVAFSSYSSAPLSPDPDLREGDFQVRVISSRRRSRR